jgi:hypothetical protein
MGVDGTRTEGFYGTVERAQVDPARADAKTS